MKVRVQTYSVVYSSRVGSMESASRYVNAPTKRAAIEFVKSWWTPYQLDLLRITAEPAGGWINDILMKHCPPVNWDDAAYAEKVRKLNRLVEKEMMQEQIGLSKGAVDGADPVAFTEAASARAEK